MQEEILARCAHSHGFGQEKKRPGELRTFIVIALTIGMMAVEITAGIAYGSIALLAGGLHMGSHAVALSVNALAYVYARRQAFSERFSFGTGKVNTLGVYRCDSVGLFCLADGLGKLPATVKPDKHCI